MSKPTRVNFFLTLIHKHFSNILLLNKFFNKNNIKISYSSTKSLEQYIAPHHNLILNKYLNNFNSNDSTDKNCNCRKNSTYPLNA